ncbi:hypothetical protein H1W37_08930 [Stappia taiwanensis]|uniref:Uncharacterized protein n=1 Tax=Stappia taiwanensis TaxID=992267 RepID=A0A838XRT1_9HYPH|nr:hypothetical protein [Stappia taiwanensis]MBA4611771.1 hypothetical protein [Stappia taiwanensis]
MQDLTQGTIDTSATLDPDKEIRAWKAFFAYAAEDLRGNSPELLVACAHRLLEMAHEKSAAEGGTPSLAVASKTNLAASPST